MDPRRAMTERNAHYTKGPRFFREDGVVMFEFVIDAGNVLGPRPANKSDSLKHDEAWAAFVTSDVAAPVEEVEATSLDQGPPVRRAYRRKSQTEAV